MGKRLSPKESDAGSTPVRLATDQSYQVDNIDVEDVYDVTFYDAYDGRIQKRTLRVIGWDDALVVARLIRRIPRDPVTVTRSETQCFVR